MHPLHNALLLPRTQPSQVFQSGGHYDLRVGAVSDDQPLHAGCVVIALGARYAQLCANVARTLLVGPTAAQKSAYEAVLAAQVRSVVDFACVVAWQQRAPGVPTAWSCNWADECAAVRRGAYATGMTL